MVLLFLQHVPTHVQLLLKNVAVVLLLKYYSLNCNRLVNHWKVGCKLHGLLELVRGNCKHEGSEKPINVRGGYSCFRTSNAYKFQIAVDVVFHKAVDPAVITQQPVTLTSEMVAVYADVPPLNDVNRQLLNFI